jgi:glycosyltransferase involved in cell wall biosynthesis
MESVLFALALCTLVFWCATAVFLTLGNRRIAGLGAMPPAAMDGCPKVSVVFAARDEERNLERALASMLALDYQDLEIIAVNDRSVDATGAILARLAARDPRLRVVTVSELPPGWLGKNHALDLGARQAAGEWLLFTDADIVMHPQALARAVGYATARRLDHLAVAPRVEVHGFALNSMLAAFSLLFGLYAQPWKARDPRSARHAGIGAFNLVRAAAYRAIGGHRRIALRPDDDMKLGKLVKLAGYRQELALGVTLLSVEWYASFGEMVRGMMKNMFAGVEYSTPLALAGVAVQLALNVWPFVAPFFTGGAAFWLNLLAAALILLLVAWHAPRLGGNWRHVPGFPLGALICAWLLFRSMWLALRNGGIEWRGTHYRLEELRANRV